MAGVEMPSSTRTPSPSHSPRYNPVLEEGDANANPDATGDGPLCIDQWEWKTDVPEFVPGGMNPSPSTIDARQASDNGGGATKQVLNPEAPTFLAPWGMQAAGSEPAPTAAAAAANSSSSAGAGGGSGAPWGDSQKLSELCAQYEWQLQTKADELQEMQNRMNQLKIETAQARATWEAERRSLVRQISHYRAVLERYWIPLEEAGTPEVSPEEYQYFAPQFESSQSPQWTNGAVGEAGHGPTGMVVEEVGAEQSNSLDSKMKQLNNLLQEPGDDPGRRSSESAGTGRQRDGAEGEGNGLSSGSIASTLRAMFPHATIRTRAAGGDGEPGADKDRPERYRLGSDPEEREVEGQLKALETSTKSQVDERALHAFQSLSNKDAKEAVGKVEELVRSQGGHCRNLSSILQSVCRKIERRSSKPQKENDDGKKSGHEVTYETPPKSSPYTQGRPSLSDVKAGSSSALPDSCWTSRSRHTDEESISLNRRLSKEPSSTKSSVGKRSSGNKSWADILSGDEDDGREEDESAGQPAEAEQDDVWTVRAVEKAANSGLELRRKGEESLLQINMSNLDPPFTEVGMDRYCQWLSARLAEFTKEHGAESLQHCRGEVDFSHNNMSNQMVWSLLRTLSEFDVHVALLKLFANRVSQGGVLSICEFIRKNTRAEGIHELHLSHNEIEDESALELLRTLQEARPRYPPRRMSENSSDHVVVPVWLRLNHNRIRNPADVLQTAEAEGISICTASDRQECGTLKCYMDARECPLVHLYSFHIQDVSKEGDADSHGDKSRWNGKWRS
mmetsp:Transcript_55301/g.102351  ORF Transcript_55301/g.102351 Transcript_55301/m.102351 type:complete len:790 (+) Transcript_55301:135-2504(+)